MFLFQKVFHIISSCCSWHLWYMSTLIHILIKYNSLSMQKGLLLFIYLRWRNKKKDKRILIKGTGETKIPIRVHFIAKACWCYLWHTFFNSLASGSIWRGNVEYSINKYKQNAYRYLSIENYRFWSCLYQHQQRTKDTNIFTSAHQIFLICHNLLMVWDPHRERQHTSFTRSCSCSHIPVR